MHDSANAIDDVDDIERMYSSMRIMAQTVHMGDSTVENTTVTLINIIPLCLTTNPTLIYKKVA